MTATNWNSLYGCYYGNHMVDSLTDTVFFSDLLPERCPTLYKSIDKILKDNDIDHRLLSHTKDIWCRDYMPIQTREKRLAFYKYAPDYLQTKYYQRTITDVNQVGNIECLRQDGEVIDVNLVIDGGNVVRCDDMIVMTEKVFYENKDKLRNEIHRLLEDAFECDIIFLPWDRNEILGHSDGIVHYVGGNRVLMTNYADFDTLKAHQFLKRLEKYVEVIPLEYNVKQKHRRSWAYINFLQIGKLVLVPQLGIPEDEQALQQIADAMPSCKVIGVPALEVVRKGGALNCISWNVATTKWNSGFMGEEYRVHGRPVSWIKKAAEKGYRDWQCNLGCCYFYGLGIDEENNKDAVKWFKRSASKGFIPAFFALGLCYYFGNGVRKNKKEALKFFKRAAKYGYAEAVCMIGDYYFDDIVDEEEAVRYYKRAVELGCERAAEILSLRGLQKSEEPKVETAAPAVETFPFPVATEDLIDDLPF